MCSYSRVSQQPIWWAGARLQPGDQGVHHQHLRDHISRHVKGYSHLDKRSVLQIVHKTRKIISRDEMLAQFFSYEVVFFSVCLYLSYLLCKYLLYLFPNKGCGVRCNYIKTLFRSLIFWAVCLLL